MLQTIICKPTPAYGAKRGGGTIANSYEVPLLDAGAMAIFDEDGNLVSAGAVAADVINSKTFRIAIGQNNADAGALLTSPIHKNAFNQTAGIYKAAVKQVIKVGKVSSTVGSTGLPVVLIPDMDAEVTVTNVTPNYAIHVIPKRYSVRVKNNDSEAGLLQRLIDLINKDGSSGLVASPILVSGVVTGITFTAVDNGKIYKIGMGGVFEDCSIFDDGTNGSVLMITGRGTYDMVLAAEKEANIQRGDAFRAGAQQLWFKTKSMVIEGLTYNSWTISQANKHVSPTMRYDAGTTHFQIFAPVGSAIYTTLSTLIPAIFGEESIEGGAEPTNDQTA